MKIRLWSVLIAGLCVFLASGIVFAQEGSHIATQLPEASNPNPDLTKAKEKEAKKLQETTKDTAALKVKLILSSPMPIFSAKSFPELRE
jgi:hypothetical protein